MINRVLLISISVIIIFFVSCSREDNKDSVTTAIEKKQGVSKEEVRSQKSAQQSQGIIPSAKEIGNSSGSIMQTSAITSTQQAVSNPERKDFINKLIFQLKDGNINTCRKALYGIYQLCSDSVDVSEFKEVIPSVIPYLNSEDKETRNIVIEIIVKLGAKELIPALLKLIEEKKEWGTTRWHAIDGLGLLGANEAVPRLIGILSDKNEDRDARMSAANALGILGAKEAVPGIMELFRLDDHITHDWIAESLVHLDIKEVMPEVLRILSNTPLSMQDPRADVYDIRGIIKELNDKDRYKRISAICELGQAGNKDAIPILTKLINDPDVWVRCSAIYSLGMLNAADIIPELLGLINDSNEQVRKISCVTLCRLGNNSMLYEVRNLLKDEWFQWYAIDICSKSNERSAIPEITALLKSDKRYVKQEAVYALANLGAKESIPGIIKLLEEWYDANMLESAIDALVKLDAKESVPALINILKDDKYIEVVDYIENALDKLKSKDTASELIKLLKDPSVAVRRQGLNSIGELEVKDAIPDVIKLLDDSDVHLRGIAIYTLGKLGAKNMIPEIMKFLKSSDNNLRIYAVRALSNLDAKESIPDIINLLDDTDFYVRQYSIRAVGHLCAKEAIPKLIKMLVGQDEWEITVYVISSLSELNAKEAAPQIREKLNSSYGEVYMEAALALGELGDKESIPQLIVRFRQCAGWAQPAIAYALGQLGAKEVVPEIRELIDVWWDSQAKRGMLVIALVELGAKDQVPKKVIEDIKPILKWGGTDTIRAKAALKELGVDIEEEKKTDK